MGFYQKGVRAKSPWSLPVQGAWIEILLRCKPGRLSARRSPCRERGLKFFAENVAV